jgi:hypothetical protein
VAARAGREDVENHLGPVHHADAERFLEVDALDRGEAFVEQQQRRPRVAELSLERLDLALPQEEVGGGGVDPLEGAADDVGAGGVGEPRQLVEVLLGTQRVVAPLARGADQIGALYGGLDVDQRTNSWTLRGVRSKIMATVATLLQMAVALLH